MWVVTYTALFINLLVIYFIPKKLTRLEIYVSWFVIAMINLSSDIVFSLYFKLYELNGSGIQLKVHILEWLLASSYGVIFLNFMPHKIHKFYLYLVPWLAYSIIFEYFLVHLNYINYTGWKLWYSAVYYLLSFMFLRWHIHFVRSNV